MAAMKSQVAAKAMKAMKAVSKAASVPEVKKVTKSIAKKKPAAFSKKLHEHAQASGRELTTAEKINLLQSKMKPGQDTELDKKIMKYKEGKLDEVAFGKDDMHKLWARLKVAREHVSMLHIIFVFVVLKRVVLF